MIVISRNRQHWYFQLTDSATGRRDSSLAGGGRVEKITSNQNELGLMFSCNLANSPNHLDALLLNECAFLWVFDSSKGLSRLPIRSVDETPVHERVGCQVPLQVYATILGTHSFSLQGRA